jgi:hypothetical protein
LFLTAVIYRGDKLIKAKGRLDKQIEDIYGAMTEIVDNVSYQGGFPAMPKPCRLNLGITESELVLFDKAGNSGRIEYGKMRKVDRFTTKHQRDRKHRLSLIAYGPIAMMVNKPTFRHFFTVEYIDSNEERNNLLVTVGTKEIAENLYKSVRAHIKQGKKK